MSASLVAGLQGGIICGGAGKYSQGNGYRGRGTGAIINGGINCGRAGSKSSRARDGDGGCHVGVPANGYQARIDGAVKARQVKSSLSGAIVTLRQGPGRISGRWRIDRNVKGFFIRTGSGAIEYKQSRATADGTAG